MALPDEIIPTRHSLLSRLKDWDDSESWREFFNTYWKLIYGVALKAGLTEVEAQEVVQETIIAVSKMIPEFHYDPSVGSFKGWLLHMTRWRINDQYRKRQRENRNVSEPGAEDSTRTAMIERVADPAGMNLDAVWEAEWENAVMGAALERIRRQVKPKQYQIFDLYVIKKWALEKVVETLGVTSGQVYLAKHRISNLIKAEVKNLEKKML
jgi:RNA polymerase sigma-70 factor (ECF subfamily)